MDLSFLRRAEARFASRAAAHPDFGMLVAALRAQQEAAAGARAQARTWTSFSLADPLVELLLGGPRLREAQAAQRGAFHPALARQRRVN
jgi:hypothetical protein